MNTHSLSPKVLVVTGIISLGLLTGCAAPKTVTVLPSPAPSPSPAELAQRTYTNTQENFAVMYPANWAVKEFDGGVGFYLNDPGFSMENAAPVMVRFTTKLPSDAQLSLENYAKVAAMHEIQNYQSLSSIKPVTTSSGVVGYQTTWKVLGLGPNAQVTESLPITYFAVASDKNKVIQISAENPQFTDIYDQIVKSVH